MHYTFPEGNIYKFIQSHPRLVFQSAVKIHTTTLSKLAFGAELVIKY